ncbi:carrier protein [Cryptosporidium andersoni]|uniref:Carrier protein n=1 Tax=Cryptosporidium andersoni TaxID=117008 RepID=A0A1J4MUF8_9CRYT|nr:carrier protein [Cryptosporidium andersoni]
MSSPLEYAFCALGSAIVAKTIVAPFDRIRLLYQVQGMMNSTQSINIMGTGNTLTNTLKYKSLYQTIRMIYNEEGLLSFWCGNLINIYRSCLVYILKFSINDTMKLRRLKREQLNRSNSETSFNSLLTSSSDDNLQKLNVMDLLLSGGFAGFVQKFISYPLEILSVRISLGININNLNIKKINDHIKYDGIFNCIQRIYRYEGISGFYKGIIPTVLTGTPYVAIQLTSFELYKRLLIKLYCNISNSLSTSFRSHTIYTGTDYHLPNDSSYSLSYNNMGNCINKYSIDYSSKLEKSLRITSSYSVPFVVMISSISGILSSITSLFLIFPGDTIKKRMMTNGIDGSKKLYTNSIDCIRKIYKKEGIRSFYYGLRPSILKSIPSGALQFGVYELSKHFFQRRLNEL